MLEILIIIALTIFILNQLGFNTKVTDNNLNLENIRQKCANYIQPKK